MKPKVKRLSIIILLLLLVLPLTIDVFAHGGAGGVSQPGSPEAHAGDFPYMQGYGFRVFLYDTESNNELWTGEDTYQSKANVGAQLDANASQSAFYLNVGSDYKAYDEQYGDTPWVGVDTISADTFNTMPGMSGYSNPVGSYKDTDFNSYASVFNQLEEKAGTAEGMQEILDWYSSKGVNTSGYNAETTLVVVEPVVKWKYNGGYFTLTYQDIRKYDGSRDGCFSFFNFTPCLEYNCIDEGDQKIPQPEGDSATSYINGYLGAFYQSWVYDEGDCKTLPFDSSSGYAYYGCQKLKEPDPTPTPTLTPTPTPTPTVTPTPEITPPVIEEVDVDGGLKLQDYQLNYVYPNVVKSLGSYTTLTKNEWTYTGGTNVFCSVCPYTVGRINYERDYNITVKDISSGTTVSKDNSLAGTKVLLYNTAAGAFSTRNVLLSGMSVNTSSSTTYVVDYGFNLIRSLFGDKRTVSTISSQSIGSSFAKTVLELNYGNKPNGVRNASSYRNSFASIGTISDTLAFKAHFNATGSINGYQDYYVATHSCYDDNDTEEPEDDIYGYATYHSLIQDKILNAFTITGSPSTTFSLSVNSLAYKYSTKSILTGKNAVSGLVNLIPCEENGLNKKLVKTYAFGVVHEAPTTLKVYPEVEMMAYEYSGNTINGLSSVTPKKVLTMGEEIRTIQSSSLYLYTVKSNEDAYADVTGITYSDTAVGGDYMLGANKVVVPGGGDFTFTGDSNFTINLYGYSLDVVNSSCDGTGFEVSDSNTVSYSDIIADGSDVYSAWGNSNSTRVLKDSFEDWATKVMDIDNYAVDLDLEVGSGYAKKTYNNFSSVIGSFTDWEVHEELVFPIFIKNGSIDKTTSGYRALIESIANDYDCTRVKAIELFEASGLCTAIYNAIESSNSSGNNSQGVSGLGSTHWYDEQVKSLVVRRYKADPIYIRGITCADKMDFGAVQNQSTAGFHDAKWFLTLYFTNEMEELGNFTVYNPANVFGTRTNAIRTGNILVNKLYVAGADFQVGHTTTHHFGH